MSNQSFPALPSPSLTLDSVKQFLLDVTSRGPQVYVHPKEVKANIFFIVLSDLYRIRISVRRESSTGQVQLQCGENVTDWLNVSTQIQLEKTVDAFAKKVIGEAWRSTRISGRLAADTPASNYSTISSLIGGADVEAVFDPYLENSSLTTILEILSFGSGGVANGIRLLGSTKKLTGRIPRLTKTGVDAWLTERGVSGEVRIMAADDEHRRFLLLSNGKSLILGPSFNAIHKNEATHVEPDTEDRNFFEGAWQNASLLV